MRVLILAAGLVSLTATNDMTAQAVYRDSDGRELTLSEVRAVSDGVVRLEVLSGRTVPDAATRLHVEGREAASAGDMARALELFQQAAETAPDWPYPLYDIAFTYVLLEDYPTALDYYRRTLNLAPGGFFTAITAVHYLELEASGDLPQGLYNFYTNLEWMEDLAEKERALRRILEVAPAFAPAWLDLALLMTDPVERETALTSGLASEPDAETYGVLVINKALGLFNRGERQAAVQMLGALALDSTSSRGAGQQAKMALGMLLEPRE